MGGLGLEVTSQQVAWPYSDLVSWWLTTSLIIEVLEEDCCVGILLYLRMACHQELLLDLNSDCAEFCPLEGYHNLLAVGTYQLNEDTQQRQGRLHLYSLRVDCEQQAPQLKQTVTLDTSGIFDVQWTLLPGRNAPCLGLALADGTLRILATQEEITAGEAERTSTSSCSHQVLSDRAKAPARHSGTLQHLCSCQAAADSMALYLDWHPKQQTLAAVSSSAGFISLIQVRSRIASCNWGARRNVALGL